MKPIKYNNHTDIITYLQKITPDSMSGIFCCLDMTIKLGPDMYENNYNLKLYIVGKTYREYHDRLSDYEPWYFGLEPETTDYSKLKQLNYEEFDRFIESLKHEDPGLLNIALEAKPKTLFSDYSGAFIHHVIDINFDFGENPIPLKILYPNIGENIK